MNNLWTGSKWASYKPTEVVKEKATPQNNFPIVSGDKTGTLIINSELAEQINIFHSFAGSTEWSGILLYKVLGGDILKPNDLKIEALGMYPMDIGTPGYTEYDYDERTLDMYDLYPDALKEEWRLGHIHTHHNMKAFFSGTDLQELRDNTVNHAYYLSLIVNFKGEYCAKICIMGDREVKESSVMAYTGLFSDKTVNKKSSKTSKEEIVYAVDLDIQMPDKAELDALKKKPSFVKEILELKAIKREAAVKKPYGGHLGNYSGGSSYSGSNYGAHKKEVEKQLSFWDKEVSSNAPLNLTKYPRYKGDEDKLMALFVKKLCSLNSEEQLKESDTLISHPDKHFLDDLLMGFQKKYDKLTAADQDLYFQYISENIKGMAELSLAFYDSHFKAVEEIPFGLINGLVEDTYEALRDIEEHAAIFDRSDFLGGVITCLEESLEGYFEDV